MSAAGPTPPGAAAATTSASVLRGSLWSFAALGLPQVYVLLLSVIAARYLGPTGMGRQSYISFVALSATMTFTGGLSIALMRFIGETLGRGDPGAVRGLVRWAWGVGLGGAVLGGGAIAAAGLSGADPEAAWLLAAAGCSLGILHAIPSALLIGAQRWREASVVGLVTGTVAVPAVLVVLELGGGIVGMFAVEAVVAAANLAWTSLLAARTERGLAPRPVKDPELRRRTAIAAVGLSINTFLAIVVFRRSEFFFLERFSTDSEIAIYSIAFAATTALALLPQAMTSTVMPAFATLFGAGEVGRLQTGFARALRMLVLVSLPITAAMLALGPEALRLVYGDDYAATGPVLRLMMIVFPIVPLLNVSYALLIGTDRLRALVLANAAAAAVNVALALLLIPSYDAEGAAVANGGAQLIAAVAVLLYTRRLIGPFEPSWRSIVATTVASAAGGAAAWAIVSALGGVAGCVLGMLGGTAVFAGLAVALRIVPARDADWLAGMAGDRLGGGVAKVVRLLAPSRAVSRPDRAESRP